MHLDDERSQRLLHNELSPGEASAARAHLAECPACREQIQALEVEERQLLERLRLLDHPGSRVTAQGVMAAESSHRTPWQRWAAVAVMAVGLAGVAYAIPGSPVRRWVARLMAPGTIVEPISPKPPSQGAPQAPAESPSMGGIAVDPGARLIIAFQTADPGSRVLIQLVGSDEVMVRAPNGAANYTAGVGQVVVDNRPGPVEFLVEIPINAPRVEIRVAGNRIFLKDGARATPAISGTGPFVLPLTR
jgi:hypothetical protein